jgi:hypothetical protein
MKMEDEKETCVRCGDVEEDRRTLWMACFYAMEELGLPFQQKVLFSADPETLTREKEPDGITLSDGRRLNITAGTVRCHGELRPQGLYTLRVCKDCRASWMEAVQRWFNAPAEQDFVKREVGTGIFVRRNGANVEVTEEEWRQMQAEKADANDEA